MICRKRGKLQQPPQAKDATNLPTQEYVNVSFSPERVKSDPGGTDMQSNAYMDLQESSHRDEPQYTELQAWVL